MIHSELLPDITSSWRHFHIKGESLFILEEFYLTLQKKTGQRKKEQQFICLFCYSLLATSDETPPLPLGRLGRWGCADCYNVVACELPGDSYLCEDRRKLTALGLLWVAMQ